MDYLVQGSLRIDFAKNVTGLNNEQDALDMILKVISSLDSSIGINFFGLDGSEINNLIVEEVGLEDKCRNRTMFIT